MNCPLGWMVYWRFTRDGGAYRFGYTSAAGGGLIRMGSYNGDTTGGVIVDPSEIEWRHR